MSGLQGDVLAVETYWKRIPYIVIAVRDQIGRRAMRLIPKEIVDKIEQRNALNEEIAKWCKENLEMDGMNSDFADITDYHTGGEQGGDDCKEWCDQTCKGEDWYEGDYYWETECKGKYLHMEFAI